LLHILVQFYTCESDDGDGTAPAFVCNETKLLVLFIASPFLWSALRPRFQALGETLAPPKGHGVLHASPLVHAGAPTAAGRRYQLVVFLVSEQWPDVAARLQLAGTSMLRGGEVQGAVVSLEHSVRANGMDPETWCVRVWGGGGGVRSCDT
jgi:hypothetical protein